MATTSSSVETRAHVSRPWDETASIVSSLLFGLGTIAYVLVVLNLPDYTPKRDWTWFVDPAICVIFIILSVSCLLASATRSAELGVLDVIVSYSVSVVMIIFATIIFIKFSDRLSAYVIAVTLLNSLVAISETVLTQTAKVLFARRTGVITSGA